MITACYAKKMCQRKKIFWNVNGWAQFLRFQTWDFLDYLTWDGAHAIRHVYAVQKTKITDAAEIMQLGGVSVRGLPSDRDPLGASI